LQYLGRIAGLGSAAQQARPLPVAWIVTLRARDHRPSGQDAGVAGIAAHRPQFHLTLAPDHPACEGNGTVGRHRHAGPGIEVGIAQVGGTEKHRTVRCGRVEDQLARADPGFARLQPGAVERNFRLLLLEPVLITSRFAIGVIDGIALVDEPGLDAIVLLFPDVDG
jgi:hypothetical protein